MPLTLSGDSLAMEVCLLLIEVCIRTYQLGLANQYLEFLETQYLGGPNGRGGNGEEQTTDTNIDLYRSKLYLFKAHLHVLHGNIKACKKEIKSLTNVSGNVSYRYVCACVRVMGSEKTAHFTYSSMCTFQKHVTRSGLESHSSVAFSSLDCGLPIGFLD